MRWQQRQNHPEAHNPGIKGGQQQEKLPSEGGRGFSSAHAHTLSRREGLNFEGEEEPTRKERTPEDLISTPEIPGGKKT